MGDLLLPEVSLGAALAVVIALVTLTALLIRFFLTRIRPNAKRIEQFLDDWQGEDDRPGVKGRPGVMARLKALEDGLAELRAALDREVERRTREEAAIWRAIERLRAIVAIHHPESFKGNE